MLLSLVCRYGETELYETRNSLLAKY